MTPSMEKLAQEIEALPEHNGWRFAVEYPGLFRYSHPGTKIQVFCTPDYHNYGVVPIDLQDDEGDTHEIDGIPSDVPFPPDGRTGRAFFDLVRPMLDRIPTSKPTKADRNSAMWFAKVALDDVRGAYKHANSDELLVLENAATAIIRLMALVEGKVPPLAPWGGEVIGVYRDTEHGELRVLIKGGNINGTPQGCYAVPLVRAGLDETNPEHTKISERAQAIHEGRMPL